MTDQLTYQNYCILYLDLLNQSEKLDAINEIAINEENKPELLNKLRETAGVVKAFSDKFSEHFNSLINRDRPMPQGATTEGWDEFKEATKINIESQIFSDSFLYYSPYVSNTAYVPEYSAYFMLGASALVFLSALSGGYPCRGAIEIGGACCLDKIGLYGPGLLNVYRFENNHAGYPRIIVGGNLFEELNAVANSEALNVNDKASKLLAKHSLEFIYEDFDGMYAIDYAGQKIAKSMPEGKDVIKSAIAFSESEWKKFKKNGDSKLAGRYNRVVEYLKDREEKFWN